MNNKGIRSRMIVTDLDGTLTQNDHSISSIDISTLHQLGKEDIVRVIATGRNYWSARQILPDHFPIDYLVFSSGAGIMEWKTKQLICSFDLTEEEIEIISREFYLNKIDFMLHESIPNSHHFFYLKFSSEDQNPDFSHRLKIYEQYSKSISNLETILSLKIKTASQFIGILSPSEQQIEIFERIKKKFIVKISSN